MVEQQPRDPARARWMMINLHRIAGVVLVLLGMVTVNGVTGWPEKLGNGLIVLGMVDVFVVPVLLARLWRTPR